MSPPSCAEDASFPAPSSSAGSCDADVDDAVAASLLPGGAAVVNAMDSIAEYLTAASEEYQDQYCRAVFGVEDARTYRTLQKFISTRTYNFSTTGRTDPHNRPPATDDAGDEDHHSAAL